MSSKQVGLLGLLSGVLHIWTFIGFGELRYFSLVFVLLYGGLGLFTYLGKRWALYTLAIVMFIGGTGVIVMFSTNTLPEWIRIILLGIDVLVVIGAAMIFNKSKK